MTLQPKTLKLLERCISDGIAQGLNRAYKHTDRPPHCTIQADIERAILGELYDWFELEHESEL